MTENIKEERLRWVEPIARGRTTTEAMQMFPHGKRTLERWLAAYLAKGAEGLEPKSTRPKTSPKETPIAVKERVIALRKKKKVCAHWKLAKQGIHLISKPYSPTTDRSFQNGSPNESLSWD